MCLKHILASCKIYKYFNELLELKLHTQQISQYLHLLKKRQILKYVFSIKKFL